MAIIDATKVYVIRGDTESEEDSFEDFNANDQSATSVVPGPNKVLGTTTSRSGYEITMTIRPQRDQARRIPYKQMRIDEEQFTLQYYEGYRSGNDFVQVSAEVYGGCRVSNVNKVHGSDGALTFAVTITAETCEITNL